MNKALPIVRRVSGVGTGSAFYPIGPVHALPGVDASDTVILASWAEWAAGTDNISVGLYSSGPNGASAGGSQSLPAIGTALATLTTAAKISATVATVGRQRTGAMSVNVNVPATSEACVSLDVVYQSPDPATLGRGVDVPFNDGSDTSFRFNDVPATVARSIWRPGDTGAQYSQLVLLEDVSTIAAAYGSDIIDAEIGFEALSSAERLSRRPDYVALVLSDLQRGAGLGKSPPDSQGAQIIQLEALRRPGLGSSPASLHWQWLPALLVIPNGLFYWSTSEAAFVAPVTTASPGLVDELSQTQIGTVANYYTESALVRLPDVLALRMSIRRNTTVAYTQGELGNAPDWQGYFSLRCWSAT